MKNKVMKAKVKVIKNNTIKVKRVIHQIIKVVLQKKNQNN